MTISICREYEFAAAHYLPLHKGKCHSLHGHNYVLQVEVSGPVWPESYGRSDTGMVVDFFQLDDWVRDNVLDRLDHTLLNESLADVYPTAENVASWIWSILTSSIAAEREAERTIQQTLRRLRRVRLYETPRSYAEVTE